MTDVGTDLPVQIDQCGVDRLVGTPASGIDQGDNFAKAFSRGK
jgi:hypothetical protein